MCMFTRSLLCSVWASAFSYVQESPRIRIRFLVGVYPPKLLQHQPNAVDGHQADRIIWSVLLLTAGAGSINTDAIGSMRRPSSRATMGRQIQQTEWKQGCKHGVIFLGVFHLSLAASLPSQVALLRPLILE